MTYLWEVRRHHSPIRKLPTSQGLESFSRRLGGVELDKDLAHARRLLAAATGSGDLQIDDGAELGALISYILANFCMRVLVAFFHVQIGT